MSNITNLNVRILESQDVSGRVVIHTLREPFGDLSSDVFSAESFGSVSFPEYKKF